MKNKAPKAQNKAKIILTPQARARASAIDTTPLATWLLINAAMVFLMIMIGAITRLTESGLSIVDWHGFKDMLPPLNDAAWMQKFAEYQVTPEYLLKNKGMDIEAFKNIYFWEWLHRLWGRVIGMVYVVPLIYFWVRKQIPDGVKPRLIALLILGALQGALGWYMVKSGLVNEPRVSHFRLAAHLGLALFLLAGLWMNALALWPRFATGFRAFPGNATRGIKRHYVTGLVLLLGTLIWGAFTAGLDAGLACSDFPKTCAQWIPQELFFQGTFFRNILNEPTAVQFTHRVWGTLTFIALFSLGIRLIKTRQKPLKALGMTLHLLILLQWLLGVGTVQMKVPLAMAAAHQMGAVLTLLVMLTAAIFVLKRPHNN